MPIPRLRKQPIRLDLKAARHGIGCGIFRTAANSTLHPQQRITLEKGV
jgi:hypothetical protein